MPASLPLSLSACILFTFVLFVKLLLEITEYIKWQFFCIMACGKCAIQHTPVFYMNRLQKNMFDREQVTSTIAPVMQ